MLSAKPKAEADSTYWDLDYLGYHSKSHLCPLVRLVCIISSFYKAFEQFSSRSIEPNLKLLFSRRNTCCIFFWGFVFKARRFFLPCLTLRLWIVYHDTEDFLYSKEELLSA